MNKVLIFGVAKSSFCTSSSVYRQNSENRRPQSLVVHPLMPVPNNSRHSTRVWRYRRWKWIRKNFTGTSLCPHPDIPLNHRTLYSSSGDFSRRNKSQRGRLLWCENMTNMISRFAVTSSAKKLVFGPKRHCSILIRVSAFAAAILSPELCIAGSETSLKIEVSNIKDIKGSVAIAIYKGGLSINNMKKPTAKRYVGVTTQTMTVSFEGISSGTYAIAIFQDLNSNATLDRNIIGTPTEPYGFSMVQKDRSD